MVSPANDAELGPLIDHAIDTSELASARWGVCAISLRDGRVLYARNADKLFTPASNMKIYTTAVALDLLGPEYQWHTSVYANSRPDGSGLLKGDLTLYGRGAPDLLSHPKKDQPAALSTLAEDLYQRGVRHISGNVIGDESYFRAEQFGNGWQWNDLQWYFGAEPSALSINGNEVDLGIKPASNANEPPLVTLSNGQDYIHLSSATATVKRGERLTVGINRGLTDNEVKVWGEFPAGGRNFGARLSVFHPALWAARLFIVALKTRGITVDGEDIREVQQTSLRNALGMVPQDTVLFNDTVRYNIRYGRWDATDAQVEAAAAHAQIDAFIRAAPKGYDTEVGERGLKLSGGEKQRVAIARTILKNPAILLFDEASSTLATPTEKEIQKSLREVSANHTTLIIAHRLTTIRRVDRIVVLENGHITDSGTHEDLLTRLGTYRKLYELQFMDLEPKMGDDATGVAAREPQIRS